MNDYNIEDEKETTILFGNVGSTVMISVYDWKMTGGFEGQKEMYNVLHKTQEEITELVKTRIRDAGFGEILQVKEQHF